MQRWSRRPESQRERFAKSAHRPAIAKSAAAGRFFFPRNQRTPVFPTPVSPKNELTPVSPLTPISRVADLPPHESLAVRDVESKRLLFGPYRTPRCRVGGWLTCQLRGQDVRVGGMTDAPIIWPYVHKKGRPSLILCGDLVRAVKRESASAVGHQWGVSQSTVHQWRKALGVPRWTIGTSRLILHRILQNRKLSGTPQARAKMRRAWKNRTPAPEFLAAARKAAKGPKSEDWKRRTAQRMRKEWASGQRQGHPAGHPWKDRELKLLGTQPDDVVARKVGRSLGAVQRQRWRLGIPSFSG
jgi:hypothetical protein